MHNALRLCNMLKRNSRHTMADENKSKKINVCSIHNVALRARELFVHAFCMTSLGALE